jgi:hypothetical protein
MVIPDPSMLVMSLRYCAKPSMRRIIANLLIISFTE